MTSDPRARIATLPEGVPDLTLGWEALAWAAKYLRHTNGPRAGLPWQFTPGQARFVLWFYSLNEDGSWRYMHASRRLAKGSGKSPFAAVMALVELLAPVRFDHFDADVLGGCVGRRVGMPWVQIAAVSEKQTENTMRHVRAMVNKRVAPELHGDYGLDVGKTQINVEPEGKLEIITSSAATAEGAEITFCVADELEHWLPGNGGVLLHSTLVDNLTKSNSRMLETLNAWEPDVGSAGEATFDDWCAQELGSPKDSGLILYDARLAPPETMVDDRDSLVRGLEWVYEDCPWAPIEAVANRIAGNPRREDEFRRKYLNWPTSSVDAWVHAEDWAMMARPDIEVGDGDEVALFFDGSLSNDMTALVGCRLSDGHVFVVGTWDPRKCDDGRLDVMEVDAVVEAARKKFRVVAFFSDVREWESFTKITWPERFKDGLRVWASPGGKHPEPVAWDMRSKTYDFTHAAELVEREIFERGFTHDGDPVLAEHVRNCRRAQNRFGVSVKKETPKSAKKIDAAVCMIGARMARRLALEVDSVSKHSGRAVFV